MRISSHIVMDTRYPAIAAALLGLLAACATTPASQSEFANPGTAAGVASAAFGQELPSAADSAAIMSAMVNWERGWDVYDPELASRDYSDEADWTNAFGARRIGRESIRAALTEVFRMRAVAAGSTHYEYHDLRFPTPYVALLRSRAIREGQLLADGSSEVRRINHLRVFGKRNGRWEIISHLIGDERTPGQPR